MWRGVERNELIFTSTECGKFLSYSSGGLSLSFHYKAGQNEVSVFCDMNRLLYFVMGFF